MLWARKLSSVGDCKGNSSSLITDRGICRKGKDKQHAEFRILGTFGRMLRLQIQYITGIASQATEFSVAASFVDSLLRSCRPGDATHL